MRTRNVTIEETQAWRDFTQAGFYLIDHQDCISLQDVIERLYLDQFDGDTNKRLLVSVSTYQDREVSWCHRGNVIQGFRKCNTPVDLGNWYSNWFVRPVSYCIADLIKWLEQVELEWKGLGNQVELIEL